MISKDCRSDDIYDKALVFAVKNYGLQLRKDQKTPHLVHALRVVEILKRVAEVRDDEILAAALLHDILEESFVKYDQLKEAVGERVADWVASLTEDKIMCKEDRKKKMLDNFPRLADEAKLIKLADRLDNLRDPWLLESGIKGRYIEECKTIIRESGKISKSLSDMIIERIEMISDV